MAFDGKQIRNATVVGAKLANLTITDAQLASDSVITSKILNLAVTTGKLADGSVIEAKVADSAVSTAKIADSAVTTAKLNDASVTTAKIVDANVTGPKLAANAVDSTKIANGSVTLAKLAADSVDSSKIVDGSITGADIAANTVAAANLVTAYEGGLLYRDGTRAMSGALDLGTGNKIINLANPDQAQDAATKAYVDSVTSGLDLKGSVRAATTSNITLDNTTTAVDGVTLANNDRVLAKNQTNAAQNGIWSVNTSGAWTRATDANTSAKVTTGMFTFVEEGSNAGTGWVLTTTGAITVGTTSLVFTQFSGTGTYLAGVGLTLSGTSFAADFNTSDGTVAAVGTQGAGSSNKVARADHSHALANGAVTAAAIADATITGAKIAASTIQKSNLDSTYEASLFYNDGSRALTGDVDAGSHKISNLTDPSSLQDAATKAYVDSQVSGAAGGDVTNKNMTGSVTSADGDLACLTGMAHNAKGYVSVFVNGLKVQLKGDKTGECWFSADGSTAKGLGSVVTSDKLYWNGSIAQYQLAGTDLIDFDYIY